MVIVLAQFVLTFLALQERQNFRWEISEGDHTNAKESWKIEYTSQEIIDGAARMIFRMVRAKLALRKAKRDLILEGDFILANTNMEVVLGMLIFLLSDVDMGLQRAYLKELHNVETMLFDRHQVIKFIRFSNLFAYRVCPAFLKAVY